MAESQKYYWIKLKSDFFNQDAIDFLMSQKNGAEMVILYQMLCLMTLNSGGKLITKLNQMEVKYDVSKIVRDTRYFSANIVETALELFKKLGLIEDIEETLSITNYKNLVGGESKYAEKKRAYRDKKTATKEHISEDISEDISVDNEEDTLVDNSEDNEGDISEDISVDNEEDTLVDNSEDNEGDISEDISVDNVRQDIRDKRLEIRDKNIELENKKNKQKKTSVFRKPSEEEVLDYCNSIGHGEFDAQRFVDYYDANGWKVGKNPMKDWKATVRNWIRNSEEKDSKQTHGAKKEELWF